MEVDEEGVVEELEWEGEVGDVVGYLCTVSTNLPNDGNNGTKGNMS